MRRWKMAVSKRVALSTHSEGGITAKDFSLAAEIEATAGNGLA